MKSSAIKISIQTSLMHNDLISSECVPSREAAQSGRGSLLVLTIMGNPVIYIRPIMHTSFSSSLSSTLCV